MIDPMYYAYAYFLLMGLSFLSFVFAVFFFALAIHKVSQCVEYYRNKDAEKYQYLKCKLTFNPFGFSSVTNNAMFAENIKEFKRANFYILMFIMSLGAFQGFLVILFILAKAAGI